MNIAIDGPSSAGKSTYAKCLAKQLNILYLDTGAMYRCLGLKAIRNNIDISDNHSVQYLLEHTAIDITHKDDIQHMFLDGEDVTTSIREHDVSNMASRISAIPCVRNAMAEMQRNIAKKADCVLDGRDIGTFVLPNAKYKFFVTAAVEIRAKRRFNELLSLGQNIDFDTVLSDLIQRDYNDTNRAFAPLKKAQDAYVIDTSNMKLTEVCEQMLKIIRSK